MYTSRMEDIAAQHQVPEGHFLKDDQNIFDQEPFLTILAHTLDVMKSPYLPNDRQHKERISARAMLVALAKEPRQDTKQVEIAPMLAGLERLDRIHVYNAFDHDQSRKLLQALIWESNKYPGWDEYLRSFRGDILSDGSRRVFKEVRRIPLFEHWTPVPETGTY